MDMEDLQNKIQEFWSRFEQDMTSDDCWDAFIKLEDLLDSKPEHQYEYIQFCLDYMTKNKYKDFLIFRYISSKMLDIHANNDFPADLLFNLFNAINSNSNQNINFNELFNCAQSLSENKNVDLAIAYYEALENKIYNSSTWFNWANCYASREDYESAIGILHRGLLQQPESDYIECNLAYFNKQANQIDAAFINLNNIIERNKYSKFDSDHFYLYAISLKNNIYHELKKPLHAIMELSISSATYSSEQDSLLESSEQFTQWSNSL